MLVHVHSIQESLEVWSTTDTRYIYITLIHVHLHSFLDSIPFRIEKNGLLKLL